MAALLWNQEPDKSLVLLGMLISFLVTWFALRIFKRVLPKDKGRANAVQGTLSVGKVRGTGIVIMISFVAVSLFFVPFNKEYLIYCILLLISMLSGYLDDMSDVSWSDYKKGAIDFMIAVAAAVTYVIFNPNQIGFQFFGNFVELNRIVYIILAIILIWIAINVTNCSDGIDGLCTSVSIVTLLTFYLLFQAENSGYQISILILCAAFLAYLWYNTYPSSMLMGDAGSRALGFFIAVLAMKSGHPLAFFVAALVLILDGGLGLVKVFVIRFFKIKNFMIKIRTPLHDHARMKMGWMNVHVVYRFALIQLICSLILLWVLKAI